MPSTATSTRSARAKVISYGGNLRYNQFDLSLAPRGDNRSEGGVYIQDEIFINDYLRWVVGARLDRFSVLDKPNFSPRTAIILKPAPDHAVRFSFNRAFRAPSLINNFLEVSIVNQLDLRAINPAFAAAPGGPVYNFPVSATGNEELVEQQVDAFEAAYTGVINKRATVTAAFYYNKSKDDIFFTQVGRYRATTPPPGWLNKVGPLVGTAQALGILEVLPPSCVGQTTLQQRRHPLGVQLPQPRHREGQGLRAGCGRGRKPRAQRVCQLLLPVQAGCPTSISRK